MLAPLSALAGQPADLPRLAGVVVGPDGASAIFADDAKQTWVTLSEGGRIGGYQVLSIVPGKVSVRGPDGDLEMTTTGDPTPRLEAPPPVPAGSPQAATVASGQALGLAALRFDYCVQRGMLTPQTSTAASQVAGVLSAMENVPARTGRGAPGAIDGAQIVAWLRDGMARAQIAANLPASAAECHAAESAWRQAARRYGAR